MIIKLNHHDALSVYEFILRNPDKYQDFYLTENKKRIFLNNLSIISKILKNQTVYAIEESEIKALFIILKEKGYRTYIKILSSNDKYTQDLFKFINWNINEEIYLKIKKLNPITRLLQIVNIKKIPVYGFKFLGARGLENLYIRKKREIKPNGYINSKN
jgi:hypothetical protein